LAGEPGINTKKNKIEQFANGKEKGYQFSISCQRGIKASNNRKEASDTWIRFGLTVVLNNGN